MVVEWGPKCKTGSQNQLKNKNSRETTKSDSGQLERQELEQIFNTVIDKVRQVTQAFPSFCILLKAEMPISH